jgi:hypothetical protein
MFWKYSQNNSAHGLDLLVDKALKDLEENEPSGEAEENAKEDSSDSESTQDLDKSTSSAKGTTTSLKQILKHEDVIQECKVQNKKLLD